MEYWTRFITWCQQPTMIKVHAFNPHMSRGGLFKGVKTGAVSGAIQGALIGFMGNVVYNIIRAIINGHLELLLDSFMTDGTLYFGPILSYILYGVILGLIFGLIFAAFYDKLPGKTPMIKGIVTSIIFWGIALLGVPALFLLSQGRFEYYYRLFLDMGWLEVVTGMYLAIFSGWLLGRLWTSERLASGCPLQTNYGRVKYG